MIWRISALFLLLVVSVSSSWSQTYEVDCSDMPLNEVLVSLRRQYDIELSFDDRLLSSHKITHKGHYQYAETLIKALLKNLPLGYEEISGVFVIFPVQGEEPRQSFLLSGQIFESGSLEPLPFSHLLINDYSSVSDLKGSFSYVSKKDSSFAITISHLGCYVLDTLLSAGRNHQLFLRPFSYDLPEVVVQDNRVERSVQIGESSGLIKLNSYIAQYLPGNGDNSVFNLLRLQPGILAAGEQPNDMIIQGSPEGTSRVLFDGITIWGLRNFSDNISVVNPYLAKSVKVYKSGYDASRADLVGGMVDITGRVGSTKKAGFNVFVNNQTVNGMMEVPVSSGSSLVLGFRQTYHNLIDRSDFPRLNSGNSKFKLKVDPDYLFHDFNAKFSFQGDNGDLFFLSVLGAEDRFVYEVSQDRDRNIFAQTNREANTQTGASLFYGKNWSSGARTQINAVFTSLESEYSIHRSLTIKRFNQVFERRKEASDTDLKEFNLRISHYLQVGDKHVFDAGMEMINDELLFSEDTFEVESVNMRENGSRLALFLQDQISIGDGGHLKPGIRVNHTPGSGNVHVDPRLDLSLRGGRILKLNASWGKYHQFLVKRSLVDDSGNYRYFWSLADDETVPVLSSTHWVAGATLALSDFTFSVEGYHKATRGMTRYVRWAGKKEAVFTGKGRSYGVDFFMKKDFKQHSLWASYSVGKAEELFPYFREKNYQRAPQDQRHELKVTGLFNISSFHFSAAWVYGSGFPLYRNYLGLSYSEPDYNRLDLSLVYRLLGKKFSGEVGLSLMNALNADNVKYTSFERIPLDQLNTVYINGDAIPFTPLLFLKVGF